MNESRSKMVSTRDKYIQICKSYIPPVGYIIRSDIFDRNKIIIKGPYCKILHKLIIDDLNGFWDGKAKRNRKCFVVPLCHVTKLNKLFSKWENEKENPSMDYDQLFNNSPYGQSWIAEQAGTCSRCQEKIKIGEQVHYRYAPGIRYLEHTKCSSAPVPNVSISFTGKDIDKQLYITEKELKEMPIKSKPLIADDGCRRLSFM